MKLKNDRPVKTLAGLAMGENKRKNGAGFFFRLLAPNRYQKQMQSELSEARLKVSELQVELRDTKDELDCLACKLEQEKDKNLKITAEMRKQIEAYANMVSELSGDIKRCKDIMKYANDYILLLDLNLVSIEVSDSYSKLGYNTSDLIGKSALGAIHPEDLPLAVDALKRGIANAKFDFAKGIAPNETGEVDLRLRKKDGSYILVHSSGSILLDENGEPAGVVVVSRDITKRKEAEKNLQEAKEKMVNFIRILGHDLRSPFSGIKGFSQLLVDQLKTGEITDETVDFAVELKKIIDNTYRTFNDLLTLGTLIGKERESDKTQVILQEIADMKKSLLSANSQMKGISVQNNVPHGLFALADPKQVAIIIQNLVGNAIKYTMPGGLVEISGKREGDFVEIVVSDNGVGMSNSQIEDIFDLGSRHYSTPGTAKEMGSGFGLLIVKNMVELNGGKVWVESELDVGTKMHFTLPVYVESAAEMAVEKGE